MDAVPRLGALEHLLAPFEALFADADVREICVNRPGEVFVETSQRWRRFHDPRLTLAWAFAVAAAAASAAARPLSVGSPFLSAELPSGRRLQVVIPPACEAGTVSLTIRSNALAQATLAQLFERHARSAPGPADAGASRLAELHEAGAHQAFLEEAMRQRRNIAVVGDTGSGKTTLLAALARLIPSDERIITMEDARELDIAQPNRVHLLFGEERAVAAGACLKSALRMRPDRIVVGELRGAEAFDLLNVLLSGHAGALTTFHATSADWAVERFAILAQAHPAAQNYELATLRHLADLALEVVVHLERQLHSLSIREVRYNSRAPRPNERGVRLSAVIPK